MIAYSLSCGEVFCNIKSFIKSVKRTQKDKSVLYDFEGEKCTALVCCLHRGIM